MKGKCEFAIFICSGLFELESSEESLSKTRLHSGQFVADFPSMLNDKVRTVSLLRCLKSGDTLQIKKALLVDFLSNNPGLFIYVRDKLVVD